MKLRLGLAFFIQAAVLGLWVVNFPVLLDGVGLGWMVAYIGAISAFSTLLAPMFGAWADDKVPADRLYRWLCWAACGTLGLFFVLLDRGVAWPLLMVVYALFWIAYTPTWSLLATICFANLPDKDADFPQVRAMGTVGWLLAGLVVSLVLHSDASSLSGYVAAAMLAVAACFAYCLPETPPAGAGARTLRRILGLEALALLKDRDQRVFFMATLWMSLPLAAFYPYTPRLLEDLGISRVAGIMVLGQITELVAMFTLVGLMTRWRVKWLISLALFAAMLRYVLYVVGVQSGGAAWVVVGLSLHGIAYTFHMITGQVFLERRVEKGMRGQAQALLSSFAGIGSLFGSLAVGQWFLWTVETRDSPAWSLFWGSLALIAAAILIYFISHYRGRR